MERTDVALVTLEHIGHVSADEYADICASLMEQVEAGEITIDDMSNVLFGPDPTSNK